MGAVIDDTRVFFRGYGALIEELPHVEPIYADLAIAFRWQPSEIDRLTFDELLRFHHLAIERCPQESN
ncbi:GpE family phage tail protein [Vibrio kasasachensis]|uniref:GpE family phage tail protein n=1 Tax=Vibrio kasasachensis TaxID=2910248 RepID=UPI003D0B0AD8